MKLIVFYSFNLQDDITGEDQSLDGYVIVNVPDKLLQSQFKDYVQDVYFDKIYSLEANCNSGYIYNFGIDKVEFITEFKNNGVRKE